MGSIIAQAAIAPLRTNGVQVPLPKGGNANPWLNHVMQIYSLFMFLGIFTTLLIPETKRKTLEELAGEWDLGNEAMTLNHEPKRVGSTEVDEKVL